MNLFKAIYDKYSTKVSKLVISLSLSSLLTIILGAWKLTEYLYPSKQLFQILCCTTWLLLAMALTTAIVLLYMSYNVYSFLYKELEQYKTQPKYIELFNVLWAKKDKRFNAHCPACKTYLAIQIKPFIDTADCPKCKISIPLMIKYLEITKILKEHKFS